MSARSASRARPRRARLDHLGLSSFPTPTLALTAVLACAASCGQGADRGPCEAGGPLGTICGFQSPEDVEFVQSADLVIVTNMRRRDDAGLEGESAGELANPPGAGFIAGWVPDGGKVVRLWPRQGDTGERRGERRKDKDEADEPRASDAATVPVLTDAGCTEPPEPSRFSPHGATSHVFDGETRVFITAHATPAGGREAVEVFALTGQGEEAQLDWIGCIPTPNAIQANDVTVTSQGVVVVSNYQPDDSLLHTIRASFLGTATGDVLAWSAASGWRHVGHTRAGLANGVAVSRDGQMLFFAESVTGLLHRLPLDGGGGAIAVEVGGNPDNLSWTRNGRLLLATHTAGCAFALCLLGRRPCKTSWEILEVDPATLAVRKVLAHDGTRIGAVSSVAQVGDKLVLGAVFDDRIGIVELGSREEQHASR